MSPGEKLAYNAMLVLFSAFLLTAVYYCVPSVIYRSIYRFAYYFNETNNLQATALSVAAELPQSGTLVARSVSESTRVFNTSYGLALGS